GWPHGNCGVAVVRVTIGSGTPMNAKPRCSCTTANWTEAVRAVPSLDRLTGKSGVNIDAGTKIPRSVFPLTVFAILQELGGERWSILTTLAEMSDSSWNGSCSCLASSSLYRQMKSTSEAPGARRA